MQTLNSQASQNHMKVVIEQLIKDSQERALEWHQLTKKQKLVAWGEWAEASQQERPFMPFNQIIQALEEVA